MGVGLMRYVEHEFVDGGVEHVVQRDGGLHETEVGANVTAVAAELFGKGNAETVGEHLKLIDRQPFYVGRRFD